MEVLALIPAKGTSTRIPPGKNMKPLAGKPLVQWTIEAALGSSIVTRTVVSTEDGNIAILAASLGAEQRMRPTALAKDPAEVGDVACHVLRELEAEGYVPDCVVMLLPTSPFRTEEHIDEALMVWVDTKHHVVSVCDEPKLNDKLRRWYQSARLVETVVPRRDYALLNGAIWIAMPCDVFRYRKFPSDGAYPYVMDRQSGLDIDWPEDWAAAEYIAKERTSETAVKGQWLDEPSTKRRASETGECAGPVFEYTAQHHPRGCICWTDRLMAGCPVHAA